MARQKECSSRSAIFEESGIGARTEGGRARQCIVQGTRATSRVDGNSGRKGTARAEIQVEHRQKAETSGWPDNINTPEWEREREDSRGDRTRQQWTRDVGREPTSFEVLNEAGTASFNYSILGLAVYCIA